MKIQTLVKANSGIPFYTLSNGEFFQFIVFTNGKLDSSPYLFEQCQVLMKVDRVGAIDFPYDAYAEENTLYIEDKMLVKVIKKTDKIYKKYTKEAQQLLAKYNKVHLALK